MDSCGLAQLAYAHDRRSVRGLNCRKSGYWRAPSTTAWRYCAELASGSVAAVDDFETAIMAAPPYEGGYVLKDQQSNE